jgi:hypothetical protein
VSSYTATAGSTRSVYLNSDKISWLCCLLLIVRLKNNKSHNSLAKGRTNGFD